MTRGGEVGRRAYANRLRAELESTEETARINEAWAEQDRTAGHVERADFYGRKAANLREHAAVLRAHLRTAEAAL